MPFAKLQKLLLIGAGLLVALAATIVLAVIMLPLGQDETDELASAQPKFNAGNKSGSSKSDSGKEETGIEGTGGTPAYRSRFELGLTKRLQRPVVDPPVQQTPAAAIEERPVVVAQAPKLNIELIGTAVDEDAEQSRAWIRINGSQEKLVQIGDIISGVEPAARLKLIEAKRVVVESNGFDLEFKFD